MMRLLQLEDDGQIAMREIDAADVPPYAILSHFREDGDVRFHDVLSGVVQDKRGYKKVVFCANQAKADGLEYFWVDTCCINKFDLPDLTTALNSILNWYRDASKCYVYLSDVSAKKNDTQHSAHDGTWIQQFRNSKWFTRLWTLQELLAPPSMDFYSQEGTWLGSKVSLELTIHEITGIPCEALQGQPLSQFSVAQKMSWTSSRVCKTDEDYAYSIMGMFDVQMSLVYGEGREEALRRLREKIYGH
jgi:hypothetical protein